MPTEAMQQKLDRGRAARHDYEDRAAVKAAKRRECKEIWAWVKRRYEVERHLAAFVALSMLRSIHGKGNVTQAMVDARMRAQDERFGINSEPTTSERSRA
jgi:hypothetical protein